MRVSQSLQRIFPSLVTVNSIVSLIISPLELGFRGLKRPVASQVLPQQGLRRLRSQIEDKRNADVVTVDLGAHSQVKRQLSDGQICRHREFRAQASG